MLAKVSSDACHQMGVEFDAAHQMKLIKAQMHGR